VAAGGLEPDLTLVLDLPLEAAASRRNRDPDRMEDRDREYLEAVKRGFLFEAGRRPDRHRIIDAGPDVELVQRAIRREVSRLLGDFGWPLHEGERGGN
jgi:dTMP kinase